MKTYLLNVWDSLRSSYWFVPSLFVIGAIALSVVLPMVDRQLSVWQVSVPESIPTTTEAARATLSLIASAMLSITGTVFSITVVTLSLASQQFGPRLLRRFMYDLITQATLGTFLSTGFYCLLILRLVEEHDEKLTAVDFSVFAAVLFAFFSMVMLIVFIHNIAMLIQAPQVVAAVSADLNASIDRLYPEKIGRPNPHESQNGPSSEGQEKTPDCENGSVLLATQEGYIQAVDGAGLLRLAQEHDLVIRLHRRPGDFLAVGTRLAHVLALAETPSDDDVAKRLGDQLNDCVIVGVRRTPRQDVECAVSELVEVAVRALSPGINDPFTAINCIDRLGASLGRLAERQEPPSNRYDESGRLRVIAKGASFGDVLDASFNQIRQYARDSVAVTIRLLDTLTAIAEHLQRPEDRQAVLRHAEMVLHVGEAFPEENDREDVRSCFETLQEFLNRGEESNAAPTPPSV